MESIPEEIRMMIMDSLPNTDLLNCSLVSKRLKNEARSVLRNRGSLMAFLDVYGLCQDMGDFAYVLKQMDVIPFSGISFRMHSDHEEHCQPWSAELADLIHKQILRLPWKQLSFGIDIDSEENINCPAFQLVKKILGDFSGGLEKLSLSLEMESRQEEVLHEVVQHCLFPRLKILNFEERDFTVEEEVFTSYIKAFVARTPNLQEVHIQGAINFMDNVLAGSSAVLVVHQDNFEASENISESLVSAMRTESLALGGYGRALDVERYNRITPMLLQASSKTLRSMKVTIDFALPLMCYGVCLENVREFKLNVNNYREPNHPEVLRIAKGFDFTRVFPNLTEVSITNYVFGGSINPTVVDAFVGQANAILNEPLPDRAVNIKKLHLDMFVHDIKFCSELFPDVEILSVDASMQATYLDCNIWENWMHLKELEIQLSCSFGDRNMDSAFCGIFPEEVAELEGKDEEYLKCVNIVPVMPSITGLKGELSYCSSFEKDLYVERGYCRSKKVEVGDGSYSSRPCLLSRGLHINLFKSNCADCLCKMPFSCCNLDMKPHEAI